MVSAVIVAGGNSTRFGAGKNKTLMFLDGKPDVSYSLRAVLKSIKTDELSVAAKSGEEKAVEEMIDECRREMDPCSPGFSKPSRVVTGGQERSESVLNALKAANGEIVLIQDGARPFITEEMIEKCLEGLKTADGVTMAKGATDTVKLSDDDLCVVSTTERSKTFNVQTPQGFYREALIELHTKRDSTLPATDDCILLEEAGMKVRLIPSDEINLKITMPDDLALAEFYLDLMKKKNHEGNHIWK